MPTILDDALTTVARMKIFLGISSDKHDGLLTLLINYTSEFIKTYTKRTLKSATYTQEEYDGTGTNTIILKNFPVTTFTTLEVNTAVDNVDDWDEIDSDDFWFYDDGRVVLVNGNFIEAPQKYRATYVAGYLIDFANEADTTKHTLPMELEFACQKLVSAIFNTRKSEGYTQQKVGDLSVTLKKEVFNDKETRAILDKYTQATI